MSLTLKIENLDRLENGEPIMLKLDRHGAVIGRSPHSDWSLPDPKNYVSSTHCEIDYRDGGYVLIDKSTNGTSINSEPQRLSGPHQIQDGDLIVIGHYRIRAITKGGAPPAAQSAPAAAKGGWGGWDDLPGTDNQVASAASSGWGEPAAPAPASSEWRVGPASGSSSWGEAPAPAQSFGQPASALGPASGWDAEPAPTTPAPSWGAGASPSAAPGWGSPSSAPSSSAWGAEPASSGADNGGWGAVNPAAPAKSGWDPLSTGGAPDTPADAWANAPGSAVSGRGPMAQNWAPPRAESAPTAAPSTSPAADADDPWSKFTSSNTVDWARAGIGEAAAAPAAPPPVNPSVAPTPRDPPAAYAPAPQNDGAWTAFLTASGVQADLLKASPADAGAAAGAVMKRLVAGLVVMLEARARAKAQLGAQSTTLELAGNNPLKFARSPERVLAQLLNPPERGFMEAGRAVEDSFQDLQAHQMATLAAMQGALRSTLDRFSPAAINTRAETRGLLAKILPSARNAALWEAYVKEFDGVAKGSEEAFLDVFSKAFKAAYEKAAAEMKRGGR